MRDASSCVVSFFFCQEVLDINEDTLFHILLCTLFILRRRVALHVFFVCIQKNIKIQGMSSDVLRLFLGLKPKFVLLMFSQNDDIRVKKSH